MPAWSLAAREESEVLRPYPEPFLRQSRLRVGHASALRSGGPWSQRSKLAPAHAPAMLSGPFTLKHGFSTPNSRLSIAS